MRVAWVATKANDWVLEKGDAIRNLLENVKERQLKYFGHTLRKQQSGKRYHTGYSTLSGNRQKGNTKTLWSDNIKHLTGLPLTTAMR